MRAVKPRAAGDAGDAALLRAVAGAAGVPMMVDANEKCTPVAAARLVRAAAEVDALFVEEPLPAYDLAAYRALARTAGGAAGDRRASAHGWPRRRRFSPRGCAR